MGYSHYWYKDKQIAPDVWARIVADFNKLVLVLDTAGVKLADGRGEGTPEITSETVWFNGLERCGHAQNSSIVCPWPTDDAQGIAGSDTAETDQVWAAGKRVSARTCDGDCSYETFNFDRVLDADRIKWGKDTRYKLYSDACKTGFRPYDMAVTVFLLIAKHHMQSGLVVRTDGTDVHWEDAKRMCYAHLGYGTEYYIDHEQTLQVRYVTAQVVPPVVTVGPSTITVTDADIIQAETKPTGPQSAELQAIERDIPR